VNDLTVATAWKKNDLKGTSKVVYMKMTYGNGDTSVVVNTGLHKINQFSISPTSVTAKKVDFVEVSGGDVTLTVADPLGSCYVFVKAVGT
jgi:hypothetical protein